MLPNERTTRNEAAATPGEIEALVVATDRETAKPLVEFLRAEGAHVQVATTSDSAIEEALLHRPHVVMIHDGISKSSGIDLCERLKGNTRTHFLPTILWISSSKPSDVLRIDAFSAGIDAVFSPNTCKEERRGRFWALLRSNALYRKLENKRQIQGNSIRDKRRWIRGMIHDIQNSLGAIQANFEYLSQNLPQNTRDQSLEECIQDTRCSFRDLVHNLRTVLDYERFESGDVVLRESPVNIEDLFETVSQSVRSSIFTNGKAVLLDSREYSGRPILGDSNYLKEAFINLVSFILRQQSNKLCSVTIKSNSLRHSIRIEGDSFRLPANLKQRLFSPYLDWRGESITSVGHGVGLALAKVVIELHGGSVDLDDKALSSSGILVELGAYRNSSHTK